MLESLRVFQKQPGFAAAIVLVLALCTGANSALFTVVNALQLRPLPFPHSEQLVEISVPERRAHLEDVRHVRSIESAGAFLAWNYAITGADGVLSALAPGTVVVDMSSISPAVTKRLAAAVAEKGGSMLDATVSGGEIGAINASLSIMVGGDDETFARARPIFEAMGNAERIGHIRPSGSGQVCKICNQVAIGGALAGVSEAFALAKKAGVDASRVRQALLGGFAASRVLEVHGERMLTGNYKPGFRAKLYQKDLRLANEAAAANGVAMAGTAIVTQMVNALVASGGADLDYAAIGTVLFGLAKT